MIELELKCNVSPDSWPLLQEKLQAAKPEGWIENFDVYYDTWTFDLLRQGVFVRVRNNYHLQFKFSARNNFDHVQCIERTFSLPLDQNSLEDSNRLFAQFLPEWDATSDFETIRKQNGLRELAVIENRRKLYSSDNMYLSIDHVKGLGDFFEIEIRGEENENTSEALTKLQTFASGINFEPINIGYVEMWLRLHNSLAYQLGKYHL